MSKRDKMAEHRKKEALNQQTPFAKSHRAIRRRDLLKRSILGFTVAWVGARTTRAENEPLPRRRRCGLYDGNGYLMIDDDCGLRDNKDWSCGKVIDQADEFQRTKIDFDCDSAELRDYDCTTVATSTGYHSDSHCTSESTDASCGLDYSATAAMADSDCVPGHVDDSDCNRPAIGGGTWDDGTTGKNA